MLAVRPCRSPPAAVRVTISRPSAERQALVAAVDRDTRHLERREDLRAEALRLRHGAAGELAAADAGRKAEVVLDPRAACPPGRPARTGRAAASAALRTRRTRRPRAPRGRRRRSPGRRSRERRRATGRAARRPGAARDCAAPTRPRRAAPAARSRRLRPLPASFALRGRGATSSQRYGMRLLARNSLIACERGDHWWPTSRSPFASGSYSACQASSRSSTTGKRRSSGGSQGFDR